MSNLARGIVAEEGCRLSADRWPHLHFTPGGLEQLALVQAFLDKLDSDRHEHAAACRAELLDRLYYLDHFGGEVSDADPRRCFRVHLGRDWAPLSFTLVWERLNRATGEYVYGWNGGLIYHGGNNDPLCVTLSPKIWGIHT